MNKILIASLLIATAAMAQTKHHEGIAVGKTINSVMVKLGQYDSAVVAVKADDGCLYTLKAKGIVDKEQYCPRVLFKTIDKKCTDGKSAIVNGMVVGEDGSEGMRAERKGDALLVASDRRITIIEK
ncbi:hypothetical protein E0765_04660 [Sulfuricurvum sp. IAE1]|uniref:hypothetical protein n=1 Tax=Sulfuricurvum sp. IAE1 TaxID=2546102 RepID=UPI00104D401B|nr:hypothetical protein [Sulfuricurvum sp. IAE1]TDA65776.1 hypothetical protein E0765_04660 [Sulfuricurvum sp. IAE1]